jgi:hypothetical protein
MFTDKLRRHIDYELRPASASNFWGIYYKGYLVFNHADENIAQGVFNQVINGDYDTQKDWEREYK